MTVYNYTNMSAGYNPLTLAQGINTLTNGLFGIIFYICFLIIVYANLRVRSDDDDRYILAITLFIGSITSFLFVTMQLLPNIVLYFTVAGLLGAVFFGGRPEN